MGAFEIFGAAVLRLRDCPESSASMESRTGIAPSGLRDNLDALEGQAPADARSVDRPHRTRARGPHPSRARWELEEKDRALIWMSFVEGLSAEVIAERLGLTAVNVRVRRHRILRRIGARLGVTFGSPEGTCGVAVADRLRSRDVSSRDLIARYIGGTLSEEDSRDAGGALPRMRCLWRGPRGGDGTFGGTPRFARRVSTSRSQI